MNSSPILPQLHDTIERLKKTFSIIPAERKIILKQLSSFVQLRLHNKEKALLNFICTHNSRRSHISQIWAQTASAYYGIANVECYSGGTEATAFNPRAVKAMSEAGFEIARLKDSTNPEYAVMFSTVAPALVAFSKRYDDDVNPKKDFAAIMTCSHADENCPLVSGAAKRITLTYDDPKNFDGTPHEAEKYRERVEEIGREILYAFSLLSREGN